MRDIFRRIRGAIGVGLTWAAGWAGFGCVRWWIATRGDFGLEVVAGLAMDYAAIGFIGGTIFSVALRLAEGRKRFDELRLPSFAGWGAVGGLLVGGAYMGVMALIFGPDLVFGPTTGSLFGELPAIVDWLVTTTVLGGATAAGSLALARVADDRDLLADGEEAGEVGLSADERRRLLGEGGDG